MVAIVSLLIYTVIFFVFEMLASVASKFGYRAAEDGTRNPFELELQGLRLCTLAASIVTLLFAPILGVVVLSVTLFVYLCSLTPLHPNEVERVRAELNTKSAKPLVT